MRIFALSDPHFGRDMSRFGDIWIDHEQRIQEHWQATVGPGDLVLVPGDVTWATTTKTTVAHMEILDSLPGRKVISPGNHDKWWKKTASLSFASILFLKDAHVPLGKHWTLAATMGWEQPESPWWKEADMRDDFEAAASALEKTLHEAEQSRPGTEIFLMIHYPPRWQREKTPTVFEEIIARFPVSRLVYGHIHGDDLKMAWNETMDVLGRSIRYDNASVDRTAMKPILLGEDPSWTLPPGLRLSGCD